MKKNRKIVRLLFLALLTIALILTACPSADSSRVDSNAADSGDGGSSGGGAVSSKFNFTGLGLDSNTKKIIAYFDKDLSDKAADKPVASRITVKKGSDTLEWGEGKDYTLSVEDGRLIITLRDNLESVKYTVELQAGAVKDADGGTNTASTKDFTKGSTTAPEKASTDELIFDTSNSSKLKIAFKRDVTIGDASKIKVQWKASDSEDYGAASGTAAVDPEARKVVVFTLDTPASNGNVFKVTVKPGAVFEGTDPTRFTNAADLDFMELTYSTGGVAMGSTFDPEGLGFHSDPKKIVVYFDKALLSSYTIDEAKIVVKKGANTLDSNTFAIENENLVITLANNIERDDAYTVELSAGAITGNDESSTALTRSFTRGTTPEPVKASNNDLIFDDSSKTELKIVFRHDVTIVDTSKIQVQFKSGSTGTFRPSTAENFRTDSVDRKIVRSTLRNPAVGGNIFKVTVKPGAVFTGTVPNQLTSTANLDFTELTYLEEYSSTGLGRDNGDARRIYVYFDRALTGSENTDSNKVTVEKNGSSRAINSLNIHNGKLEIELANGIEESDAGVYTVKLAPGAIKSSTHRNAGSQRTYTEGSEEPAMKSSGNSLEFRIGSATQLKIAFERNVTIGDASKIKVAIKDNLKDLTFENAPGTAAVDSGDKKIVVFTLDTAASNGNIFKVTVEPGAVFEGTDPNQLTNKEDLEFAPITYGTGEFKFTGLGEHSSYGDNILAYFDRDLSTQAGDLNESGITVKKGSNILTEGASDSGYKLFVNGRTLLIDLTENIRSDKYEVEIEAGAVKATNGAQQHRSDKRLHQRHY